MARQTSTESGKPAEQAKVRPVPFVAIPQDEVLAMVVKSVRLGRSDSARNHALDPNAELPTDTAISSTRKFPERKRELQRWVPDSFKEEPGFLLPGPEDSLDNHSGSWDQFEANKVLFGVNSTFDHSLYTTKLENPSSELQEYAERIAQEVQNERTTNIHLAEERGQILPSGLENIDEETKYASVNRGSILEESEMIEEEAALSNDSALSCLSSSSSHKREELAVDVTPPQAVKAAKPLEEKQDLPSEAQFVLNPGAKEFKLNPNAREFFPPVFPPSPVGQMQIPQFPHHLVPPGMHPGHQGFVPGGPMPMFVPPPPGHPPQYQPMMFVGPPAGPPGAYGVPQVSGPLGQPGMKVPMQGHPQMMQVYPPQGHHMQMRNFPPQQGAHPTHYMVHSPPGVMYAPQGQVMLLQVPSHGPLLPTPVGIRPVHMSQEGQVPPPPPQMAAPAEVSPPTAAEAAVVQVTASTEVEGKQV